MFLLYFLYFWMEKAFGLLRGDKSVAANNRASLDQLEDLAERESEAFG